VLMEGSLRRGTLLSCHAEPNSKSDGLCDGSPSFSECGWHSRPPRASGSNAGADRARDRIGVGYRDSLTCFAFRSPTSVWKRPVIAGWKLARRAFAPARPLSGSAAAL